MTARGTTRTHRRDGGVRGTQSASDRDRAIARQLAEGTTRRELAALYGVSRMAISQAARRVREAEEDARNASELRGT